MTLPQEAVKEFKKIYEMKFGVVISSEDAEKKALNFLRLMALITSKQTTYGNEKRKLHNNIQ